MIVLELLTAMQRPTLTIYQHTHEGRLQSRYRREERLCVSVKV